MKKYSAQGKARIGETLLPVVAKNTAAVLSGLGYLSLAFYIQNKVHKDQTQKNPMRWVNYGLLLGTGTALSGLMIIPSGSHNNPYAGIAQAAALMVLFCNRRHRCWRCNSEALVKAHSGFTITRLHDAFKRSIKFVSESSKSLVLEFD